MPKPSDATFKRKEQVALETLEFSSSQEFRAWLAKHHARSSGLLLRIYKKDSDVASITYAEALDQALCFGWIDGSISC